MALRFFAGGQVKDICHMHGVHNSTFYKVVWQVVDFINDYFPLAYPINDHAVIERTARGFSNITRGIVQRCAGVIDGIAIKIRCPKTFDTPNPMQYYNRKGFYAYVMQGVCDADLRYAQPVHYNRLDKIHLHRAMLCRLLYVSCNCVGSTPDSSAFQNSALYRAINVAGGIPGGYHLLGD